MKTQLNYQTLFELENDIEKLAETSPAFTFFNQDKIRRFAINSKDRLNVMHKTQQEIRNKYVKKDENGKFMTQEVDGKVLWLFDDKEKEKQYLKEWNDFMQITFEVVI